ncbi:hypothetical protein [Gilliamella sp. wkB171]|uniref:hypothetical protein n=1 Tax=Gilliamella sp. wkB171 TaxID=3120258 RepID=UPI000813428A|nr:hypothetical protein [Gilliamella apicola]OCL17807.1 hypothetical protein A9G03_10395 [Gilliamella apicola]
MENLTPYLNKIETILSNHQHPELDLFQLYNSCNKEQQLSLVASMIGKLIEQNKKLKHNII